MNPFRQPKPAQTLTTPEMKFVGDGQLEQSIKLELAALISSRPTVDVAYLAKAVYRDNAEPQVILVLGSDFQDRGLVDEIGQLIFRRLSEGVYLDILFASQEQESEVAKVCQPFYKRTAARP